MQDQLIGEIALVAFNFAPEGWAFCNGQLLSIAQNMGFSRCSGPLMAAMA